LQTDFFLFQILNRLIWNHGGVKGCSTTSQNLHKIPKLYLCFCVMTDACRISYLQIIVLYDSQSMSQTKRNLQELVNGKCELKQECATNCGASCFCWSVYWRYLYLIKYMYYILPWCMDSVHTYVTEKQD